MKKVSNSGDRYLMLKHDVQNDCVQKTFSASYNDPYKSLFPFSEDAYELGFGGCYCAKNIPQALKLIMSTRLDMLAADIFQGLADALVQSIDTSCITDNQPLALDS